MADIEYVPRAGVERILCGALREICDGGSPDTVAAGALGEWKGWMYGREQRGVVFIAPDTDPMPTVNPENG